MYAQFSPFLADFIESGGSLWMEIESSQRDVIIECVQSNFDDKLEIKQFKKDFRDVTRFVEIIKKT